MADTQKPETTKIESAKVLVNKGTIIGSTYAQIVGVSVTDVDITFEFVFIHPADATGQVVSRVTMPKEAGAKLSKAIEDIVKSHKGNKEKIK